MYSKVGKWGGSSAIRLPKAAMEQLGIDDGAELEITVENGKLIASPVAPAYSLRALVAAARKAEAKSDAKAASEKPKAEAKAAAKPKAESKPKAAPKPKAEAKPEATKKSDK